MTSEPVNTDDPVFTAYLLGELTPAERAEFEAKLERSPLARAEMESMEEVMDCLSRGLKDEWKRGLKMPEFEVLPTAPVSEVVVPGRFQQSRRPAFAIAAAVAATLAVIGAVVSMRGGAPPLMLAETPASESLPANSVDHSGSTYAAQLAVAVPRVFFTEEVATGPHADLATALASLDDSVTRVDASYLESRLPTSDPRAMKGIVRDGIGTAKVSLMEDSRVDSYLPPILAAIDLPFPSAEVRHEGGRPSPETSRVVVSGYVSMDADARADESGPASGASLPGFHPVSLSGNPVLNPEVDLRLVSDFQSIQNELSQVVGRLPEGAPERDDLEELLERSRRALHQLKQEFSN